MKFHNSAKVLPSSCLLCVRVSLINNTVTGCVCGKGVLGVDLVRYGCLPQRDIPQSVEDYSDAGHSHIVFVTLLCYISQSPINSLHCLQD